MEEIPQNQKDVSVAEVKAEGQELEWGPELQGSISYGTAQEEITELNTGLSEGEKPWRLPTKDELLAKSELMLKSGSRFSSLGGDEYWSSTVDPIEPDYVYFVNMYTGHVNSNSKAYPGYRACVVRDVA